MDQIAANAALEGLRVVDFSNGLTGAQASQFLADFGADVVSVEPPGGSPLRRQAAWPFWSRGKRAIQLDLKDAADLKIATDLTRGADVIIETFRPGVAGRLGLGYEALSRQNPGLVYASVSGWGSKGPLAGLQGYEGVVMAKLGAFWALEGMAGHDRPCFCSVPYCSYPASQYALHGIMAALYEREDTGLGQKVETSLLKGLTAHDPFNWYSRVLAQKYGNAFVQVNRAVEGVPSGGLSFRLLIAPTKDGKWLQFSQTAPRLFRAMMKLFELEWMFEDPKWKTAPDFDTVEQRREFWEILLNKVRERTAAEWLEAFDANPDVWGEEFRKYSEALDHPQMRWNRMVAEYDERDAGHITSPGALVRIDAAPANVGRPAPRLGEHDAAIRAEAATARPPVTSKRPAGNGPPLAGVTVVELATYYAAPFAATLLAELGARVIKLEQPDGDPLRDILPFPQIGGIKSLLAKECVAVDLNTEKGLAIANNVIARADIVLQGFRAGAARKLGLDAETLQARHPNLVYHSAPGYGEDGPYGRRPAYAPTIGAAAGMAFRNIGAAIPEGDEITPDNMKPAALQLVAAVMGVGNSDGISGVSAGTAMMLGLLARKRGKGVYRTLTSMLSSTAHCLSETMVRYKGAPEVASAGAEALGFSALYRLYETAKEWVFLAAPQPKEWSRLTLALPGGEALADDPRFASPEARRSNDAALAEALAAIFRTLPGAEWEERLTAADVACVVAAPAPVESHLMDQGEPGRLQDIVTTTKHPILEEAPRLRPMYEFSRSATVVGDAGMVGQDTERVLREFGYGEAEIKALADEGVVLLG